MQIKITRQNNQIRVASPYSPDLPPKARQISGRWDRSAGEWVFPAAAEEEVRALYLDVYGEWDDVIQDTVTLLCVSDDGAYEERGSLTLGGRVVARAYGRDSGAITADGIIVLEGEFTSGGSRANWRTMCEPGTKFKMLDVPRKKAIELVQDPDWCSKIEIIEEAPKTIDRDALIAERKRLADRIAEIDAILQQD